MVFGAFIFYQALVTSNGSLIIAILTAFVGAMLLGAIVYAGIMRPLAGYPVSASWRRSALGILLRTIATLLWSGQTRYPAEYLGQIGRPIQLYDGVAISGIDAAIVIVAVATPTLLNGGSEADELPDSNDAVRARLTPRELEVLAAMADGASNKAIARRLGISFHTAKFHVAAILDKLNADSRTEAVTKAAQLGLVML